MAEKSARERVSLPQISKTRSLVEQCAHAQYGRTSPNPSQYRSRGAWSPRSTEAVLTRSNFSCPEFFSSRSPTSPLPELREENEQIGSPEPGSNMGFICDSVDSQDDLGDNDDLGDSDSSRKPSPIPIIKIETLNDEKTTLRRRQMKQQQHLSTTTSNDRLLSASWSPRDHLTEGIRGDGIDLLRPLHIMRQIGGAKSDPDISTACRSKEPGKDVLENSIKFFECHSAVRTSKAFNGQKSVSLPTSPMMAPLKRAPPARLTPLQYTSSRIS